MDADTRALYILGKAGQDSDMLASAAYEFSIKGIVRRTEAIQAARESLLLDGSNRRARDVILKADPYQWTGYVFVVLFEENTLHVVNGKSSYSIDMLQRLHGAHYKFTLSGQKLVFHYFNTEDRKKYKSELGSEGLEGPIETKDEPYRNYPREDLVVSGLSVNVEEVKRFQDGSRLLFQDRDPWDPEHMSSIFHLEREGALSMYPGAGGLFIEDRIPYAGSDSGHFWKKDPSSTESQGFINGGFKRIGGRDGRKLPATSRAFRENGNRVSNTDDLGTYFGTSADLMLAEVPISVLMGLEKLRDQDPVQVK